MAVVGGLRSRLIKDNFHLMIREALGLLGWFDPGRQHLPINMVADSVPEGEEIPFNTLVVSAEDADDAAVEMGSNFTEDSRLYWIDFYAENDVVGEHLIFDVRDILRGKIGSIGRSAPVLRVLDLTTADRDLLFHCELEDIGVARAHNFPERWRRHWYSARCVIVDAYGDESDA